jgi:hypothetical protein
MAPFPDCSRGLGSTIWKLTVLEGTPDNSVLTAEKFNGAAGQYRKDKSGGGRWGHCGIDNDDASLKNRTLEPESMIPTFWVLTPGLG